jgi:hypothetical protein
MVMQMLRWLPFVLLLAAQDPAPKVGDLIQKLRSEDIALREAAVRQLKETGRTAKWRRGRGRSSAFST